MSVEVYRYIKLKSEKEPRKIIKTILSFNDDGEKVNNKFYVAFQNQGVWVTLESDGDYGGKVEDYYFIPYSNIEWIKE